ncbi:sulfur carrier protein ThiS [Corynebacterium pygosceleis]|uniref:Sulfur carrier protein ThiS n=1 Tax=Corynebacterium pygosceleis TaxID=2800406 RepID=A0A9Q4CBC5_9CORY|nr:sulfur carrier protein ThiS [Corynebacterium pygosceleis]MCK7638365.1 sulfur carrier protein ThiS [Corynebacterium pygosceleis]MCK7675345.1 sulfur carrier protein ThiS [Corynebacterium pygosceleis]MCL0121261.1 sulfur carrier protein ThiS [Corynebacterium pygosceleis]MCX7445476.1 sulfur carrier protein ThiS [Corynebacterium pygosceleis]MCX7469028.1 sulfur carrier protein ThiS [Corynebacterium pygosceleis]
MSQFTEHNPGGEGPRTVTVNGRTRELGPETTVRQLVRERSETDRGFAVAVNGLVVPAARWDETVGQLDAAQIDIFTAVQGG